MREWLGALCIRAGFRLISDRHALWLWRVQSLFWDGHEGRELRRRLEEGES